MPPFPALQAGAPSSPRQQAAGPSLHSRPPPLAAPLARYGLLALKQMLGPVTVAVSSAQSPNGELGKSVPLSALSGGLSSGLSIPGSSQMAALPPAGGLSHANSLRRRTKQQVCGRSLQGAAARRPRGAGALGQAPQ